MRHAVITRSSTHRPWSSSPTIIYINKLHHVVTAVTAHGQCQRRQDLLLLLLATSCNYKKKIRV
jgi:hypothetical protein